MSCRRCNPSARPWWRDWMPALVTGGVLLALAFWKSRPSKQLPGAGWPGADNRGTPPGEPVPSAGAARA